MVTEKPDTSSEYTGHQLLSLDLLAYCGYKLEGDKLVSVYYEPNLYTPVETVKKLVKNMKNKSVFSE